LKLGVLNLNHILPRILVTQTVKPRFKLGIFSNLLYESFDNLVYTSPINFFLMMRNCPRQTRILSSFTVTLSLILRTVCARGKLSGCSSTTNAHSETVLMAVSCQNQNLTLGALSSRGVLSVLDGALFKNFVLFLNTHRI
jgi:hypothetical protein